MSDRWIEVKESRSGQWSVVTIDVDSKGTHWGKTLGNIGEQLFDRDAAFEVAKLACTNFMKEDGTPPEIREVPYRTSPNVGAEPGSTLRLGSVEYEESFLAQVEQEREGMDETEAANEEYLSDLMQRDN